MKRRTRIASIVLALVALAFLALAASAGAATLTTKCSGNGPQNKAQEYETASCAVRAGEKRKIEGVVRNDKNKPVAAALKVTFSKWVPAGNSAFDITPEKTVEIKAGANGKFTIPTTTATEETVFIEAVEDADLELSPVTAEVNVQRLVTATAKKLGGGKVQVTVKGASSPVKVGITEEEG
jgi:nitrogen regulatory protein PII